MGDGLQRCPSSMATRPHPSQTYFMAASLSLQICLLSTCVAPQKLHLAASPQGLHRWPGSVATAHNFYRYMPCLPPYSLNNPIHIQTQYTVMQYAYKSKKVKQIRGLVYLRHFPHSSEAFSSTIPVWNAAFLLPLNLSNWNIDKYIRFAVLAPYLRK